ncbi:MAG: Rieske (2Fe-2S) protein [Gemmatimonadota bacterium]|nr:Rieske (2Fe-2S) protein [Gemmatimonadota bacterium]
MEIIRRIFGICRTGKPLNTGCWKYDEGRVEVDLAQTPELSAPGGAIRLEGKPLPGKRILLLHGEDGNYHACLNRCTHLGHRRLDPLADGDEGEGRIRCCSVGKSTFDYQGRVVSGTAEEPLTVLTVELEDGSLRIHLDGCE